LYLYKIIVNIHRFEIAHIHTASWWSFRKLFPVIFIAKKMGKKVVLHLHGGAFDTYFKRVPSAEKALIKHGFNLADKVVVLSEEWRTKTALFCDPRKLLILPNSVSIDEKKVVKLQKRPEKPYVILFMGEVSKLKGIYDLLDAIKILNLEKDEILVYVCGNGEVNKAKAYLLGLGLENIVNVPGWIDGQQKQRLLNDAYIYVLPSYVEGLPVSILEAMSTATPVVATGVGGIPNVLIDGYNGFLVQVHSPEMLADRLRQILADKELWSLLSRNAFMTIKKSFSIDDTETRLRSLYDDFSGIN